MAATNLESPPPEMRTSRESQYGLKGSAVSSFSLPSGLGRAWLTMYAWVWGTTMLLAAVRALSEPWLADLLGANEQFHLSPASSPRPNVLHVAALLVVNLARMGWPLALGLTGIQNHRSTRRLADALLAGVLLRNMLWVGTALGAYGSRAFPYVPQLPIEWAAIALGASGWLVERNRPLSRRERALWVALTVLVVLCAAVIETYAVPHQ